VVEGGDTLAVEDDGRQIEIEDGDGHRQVRDWAVGLIFSRGWRRGRNEQNAPCWDEPRIG
jgi:hypothetical protein